MLEAGVEPIGSQRTAEHAQDVGPGTAVAREHVAGQPAPHHLTGRRAALFPCDLVTVPARRGLEAVHILRLRDEAGPVLHDNACDTLGFLVPAGTADSWDLPGSVCVRTVDRGTRWNDREASGPPVAGTGWLVAPGDAPAATTDPARLRIALDEAAHTIEALDRCRH